MLRSDGIPPIGWADTPRYACEYGVKGATSLTVPRAWTLPFVLLTSEEAQRAANGVICADLLDAPNLDSLAGPERRLIVRSSVVGESIWERGTYESTSFTLSDHDEDNRSKLIEAARHVLSSTQGRHTGLMVQRYIVPAAQGEFGNLQRISKTRDHWETATREQDGFTVRLRLNSQRDRASNPQEPLAARVGLTRERLFGAIGAWLNNELLLGRSQRLNCEWITDNRNFYIVQIDEEDEDLSGVNPFQVRVPPTIRPPAATGEFLKPASAKVLTHWDKLEVLQQLWEPGATHKPTLFYLPLADLPGQATDEALSKLAADFALLGSRGIIVRTSVPAGAEKLPNLARTEGLTPEVAASWCFETAAALRRDHTNVEFAFVAHRFLASRASAWVRAEPGNPIAEINALWGLPDALQYCPYDIWEVHVPTGTATDYPEYKSDMLVSRDDGGWEYVRVKNELARGNSISSAEAKDIAFRSVRIAEKLGRACHIMWFIGCSEKDGVSFNIPWYWTNAHDADRNPDRAAYRVFTVTDRETLREFENYAGPRTRQAVALRPTNLDLMRDIPFIESVGLAASQAQVPVVLSGSPLAHAYYQLRKAGCTVVTPSEKEHARVRKAANLGKLVRDKIPGRIAERQEMGITRRIDGEIRKGFLISKLIEEALEVREAVAREGKVEEMADLFEVFRALAKSEGLTLDEIRKAATVKRRASGGFEDGLVLLQTAIGASGHSTFDADQVEGDVLGPQVVEGSADIPFSYFGFMEFDQPRSIQFKDPGSRLELTLRPDRLEIRLVRGFEQLSLPF